jgi:hypothetical protein
MNLDAWFMWDFTNEEKYRGSLGGKLDEYNISMLTLNSSFIAMAAYLVRIKLENSIFNSILGILDHQTVHMRIYQTKGKKDFAVE